ncbi:MAG TPA: cytochrome c [Polyangia bacterium]|jgi:mono/diheme cytochrome c family protein|nr:cytochrome c [Polyangia bacterium]
MSSLWNLPRVAMLGLLLVAAPFALHRRSDAAEPAKTPAVRLIAPENLSAATRAEVQSRMARHGNVMSNLVRAVILLDRPTIAVLALRIADEEVVARVEASGSKKWESRLPKGFFAEQDALRAAARELATTATRAGSDSAMADGFAAVARTCVACHSVYLHGRADEGK